ncbi:MAG: hypothetical protein AAFX56_08710 [Pseudomonadota bacterium]
MKRRHLVLPLLAAALAAVQAHAENHYSQVDPVVRTADGVWVGESHLLRYSNRVHAIVQTSDLDPGAAMTAWWRIYNRPQHCAVPYSCELSDLANPRVDGSQLQATAFVAEDADGTAVVVATLYRTAAKAEGGERFADTLTEGYLNGRGLRRPLHAEVEVLFASHGQPADPNVVGEEAALLQLLSPTGTQLECFDADVPTPARTFRCGVLQKVNHAAFD